MQTHRPQAKISQYGNQTNFLIQERNRGNPDTSPEMGLAKVSHGVFVFDEGVDGRHQVTLLLQKSGFSVQEYLTVKEARTLSAALAMAADHVEAAQPETNVRQAPEAAILNADIDAAAMAAGVAI